MKLYLVKLSASRTWIMSASVFVIAMATFPSPAAATGAQTDQPLPAAQPAATQLNASLAVFKPAAKEAGIRVEYPILDVILKRIVMDFGPSARISYSQRAGTGSKLKFGHSGAAALEGNRVVFSRFSPKFIKTLSAYRHDLETLGTQTDFALQTRDQQLAYWYNLHNIAVIEQIARHYPVSNPETLLVGERKLPLHDAKFLTIKGVALSLNDIRTKIVYPNWNDPLVIYGFFLGNIGGPNIRKTAYTGQNVRAALKDNATEFVNSLRGVRKINKKVLVAPLYRDAAILFPDWSRDLRAHLQIYAQKEVQHELDNDYPLSTEVSYTRVADVMGGHTIAAPGVLQARIRGRLAGFFGATPSGSTGLYATKVPDDFTTPPQVADLLRAVAKKNYVLRLRKRRDAMFKTKTEIVIVGEDRDAKPPADKTSGPELPGDN